MRELGVRCDENIIPRDCGRLVAIGYDMDKRLHPGFPVFDVETVPDRTLAIARPASRKEGKRRMLYGLDPVGRRPGTAGFCSGQASRSVARRSNQASTP